MTLRKQFYCLTALPWLVSLALLCASGVAFALVAYHDARIERHEGQGEWGAGRHYIMLGILPEDEIRDIKANEAEKDFRDSCVNWCETLFAIGVAALVAAASVRAEGAHGAAKLRRRLSSIGYDWLTAEDAFMLYVLGRREAFRLPSAAEVLTIPGHAPNVESLLAFMRTRQAHKSTLKSAR